ncbi:MAG: DUF4832 domain-containing protein [Anaerolineae bacterium]|nr:DUF4832 domain-containing protein [Anaerolineae bacterium]
MSRPTALVALLCTAGLAAQLGVGLNHLYNDPAQARADYRAIAAHIAAVQRPGDAVLLNAANQWEVFTYYHRETGDNAPVYPIPRARPVDTAATRAELDAILAAHDRLFVLYWGDAESDPARVVESYLSERAAVIETTWYQDVRLVTYIDWTGATDAADALPAVRFHAPEGDIHLTGHTVRALGLPSRPGDALAVTLRWEAETRLSVRYKVFVHLVDPDGAIVAQHDSEPAADLRPTDTWQPGETVTDNHGLQIPSGAAPGAYRVYVGLYPLDDPATRLPVTVGGEGAGDYLALATVEVE